MTGSEGSGGTNDSTSMVVADNALNAMTSDSFSGSGAGVSMALPGSSKPKVEDGLYTRSNNMFYDNESTIYK
jgi:hypothetical protein